MPIPICGLGGAFSVVAVNSWMNQPQGFSPTTGDVTKVEPLKVIFNPAVPYEVPHMILAAYLVTGFLVASVYAVGMLRGRRDRYHRLGLLIPLTVACIVTPIQFAVGDSAARAIAKDQPIKFAAMECVQTTSTHVTEYIYGRCTADGVKGGIGIPGFDSFLVGWSTDTQVIGLDTVPPEDRPPANTMLHWAFDTMVGICTVLIALGLWFGVRVVAAGATSRRRSGSCARSPCRASRAIVALECGWIVTEVGRQPWIVYEVMRTEDAVTQADGVWVTFALVVGLYAALGAALVITLRAMARRWRAADEVDSDVPYGPSRRGAPVSTADAVAGVLWVGVTAYAVFGGADFGAGFWSLVAGRGDRGRRARELVDWAIGPVWEANHVWLIFVLVVLWTGVRHRVRLDLLDAVHPAQPRRARHRAARVRVRVPAHGAAGAGAGARRAALRALVAADAVLHGHRRRRRRGRPGARRQRRRATPSRAGSTCCRS